MDKYSIESTHEALKNKLIDYIKTIYLGQNKALREECDEQIEKEGVLFQKPYIEANPAYKISFAGIEHSDNIPMRIKEILKLMSNNKLGVYENPYQHQVAALEAFYSNKDLFVATGTGSGKTECFMWPMISSIVSEAITNKKTWGQRGIRALMLYPMNALVTDQLGRLRKMIGDNDDKFHDMFNQFTDGQRIPQFGMYTGRTPYPGDKRIEQDKSLASTLQKDLLNREALTKEKLIDIGKYPSKHDLEKFVLGLYEGKHITDSRDAELITRQEIQNNCPDILITNYSMLEYMLMRPIEESIWSETKKWLELSEDNKLLFIIDEAHMYRGSAGGEVALLIRRFMNKIGIRRERLRFIMTSASIPANGIDEVLQFANDLSVNENNENSFELITGEKEVIEFKNAKQVEIAKFKEFDIDCLQTEGCEQILAIKNFGECAGLDLEKCEFASEEQVKIWLFNELRKSLPMLKIMQKCRGNATEFDELSRSAFPLADENLGRKVTSAFLAVASLAKKDGQVLFPARLHMMFRGLQGIYACSNPNCSENNGISNDLGTGKIFINSGNNTCVCGGKVYELLNDRTCGAIFLRGFIDINELDERFVWNQIGEQMEDTFREVNFYIILSDGNFKIPKGKNDIRVGWLNSITGRLFLDDNHANEKGFIHVAYNEQEDANNSKLFSFKSCPKCKKRNVKATDFITKGNEPFFNLVSQQLYIQPPTIFGEQHLKETPNAGRKVLLFSDSRQRAAVLAKDLTRAADEDAMKKALTVAACELQNWAQKNDQQPTMDLLYVAFLKVAYENGLRFFYGNDEDDLREALLKMEKLYKKKDGVIDFKARKGKFVPVPGLYHEQLLKQMCSNYRSLTDVGVCWIEPCDEDELDDVEETFINNKIKMSAEEYKILFSAWCNEIMTDSYAIGGEIDDEIRRSVTNINRLGLESSYKIPKKYAKLLYEQGYTEEQVLVITNTLEEFLSKGENSPNKYLNLSQIALKFGEKHDWYKCHQCGGVFPFTLWGKCAVCGEGIPKLMVDSDFDGVNFWRIPILKAVHGDRQALMTRINTEEHTAQLSHKDQRQKTWSTTEDYEMRFQNVYVEKTSPVDVLSCTTTMEVGIDIGSLTAVGLRNIPPMRENYQQRAGRAGRRSSAISTIVTYTDNGPHDSYYFNNPKKIISGEPRAPWIDINNPKLVSRHLHAVDLTEFITECGEGINDLGIIKFFNSYYDIFISYLNNRDYSNEYMTQLIPSKLKCILDDYKVKFVEEMHIIKDMVKKFPENYKDDVGKEKSVLDVFLEEGIFPTYSFPRNVVGFHIENYNGSEIIQKPDRALDMAISEYAPGRTIVVDKKTYKSGGIYNFHSKFRQGNEEHPARSYFASKDFFKNVFYCKNQACNWFGTEKPDKNKCPFCGNIEIQAQPMVKPWGFAPQNGASIKEAEAENEMTFAEEPCYSATSDDGDMVVSEVLENLRYAKRADQPLIILNKGPKSTGFMVCKDCGAAVPGDDVNDLKKILKPYKHPRIRNSCQHSDSVVENVFLGHQFLTDMVVYEISVDSNKVNVDINGLWIKSAAQTLAEAMVLAAGRLLDVEFNDIKSGYRLRYDERKTYIDIFMFDSLSSGAGYCATIADRTTELFDMTKTTLTNCKNNCDSACHECLKHYWNQRIQKRLNRFSALELLNWCIDSSLPDKLTYEQQSKLILPLKELALLESKYDIEECNREFYIIGNGKKKKIYVYPDMWRDNDKRIPAGSVALSDSILKRALPKAYSIVTKTLK